MQLAFDTYWMASFRTHVMGQVEMTGPTGISLKTSLSQWSVLMPDEILRKLVNQVLMPKLTQAI